jgi:hypothetical protein
LKKEAKTFANGAAPGHHRAPDPGTTPPKIQSFLVLFFKKEPLKT